MNPYASHLGSRDPLPVITGTPERLAALVRTLGPDGSEVSLASGKWSVRDILCHLADTEVAFAFRLRQSLAEAHHVIQPFDQDRWAENYASQDAETALRVFTAVREWNVRLIRAIPADVLSKRLTHPERGEMTFQVLVETMAGHDLNHLARLEALAATRRGVFDS